MIPAPEPRHHDAPNLLPDMQMFATAYLTDLLAQLAAGTVEFVDSSTTLHEDDNGKYTGITTFTISVVRSYRVKRPAPE